MSDLEHQIGHFHKRLFVILGHNNEICDSFEILWQEVKFETCHPVITFCLTFIMDRQFLELLCGLRYIWNQFVEYPQS